MMFLSPDDIADDLMLYKLPATALMDIQKLTLDEMELLSVTEVGHNLRIMYELWNPKNPYTTSETSYTDDDDRPRGVTRLVLEIIWRRLQSKL